jgi:DNA-binding NtrC family response regulator
MTFQHSSKPTILVADDEPIITDLLDAILSREGHTVLLALNAHEALEIGKTYREQIKLALVDYSMISANGNLAAYLNGNAQIRTVLMSGYTETQIRNCGVSYQFAAFLQKPFTQQIVLAVIRRVLEALNRLDVTV